MNVEGPKPKTQSEINPGEIDPGEIDPVGEQIKASLSEKFPDLSKETLDNLIKASLSEKFPSLSQEALSDVIQKLTAYITEYQPAPGEIAKTLTVIDELKKLIPELTYEEIMPYIDLILMYTLNGLSYSITENGHLQQSNDPKSEKMVLFVYPDYNSPKEALLDQLAQARQVEDLHGQTSMPSEPNKFEIGDEPIEPFLADEED